MTLVAGDDVIGLCGLRAVQKFRVGRVGRNGSRDVRLKELTLIVEHGERRRDLVRRKRKFRPREHGRVFLEDVLRETGMHQALMDGEQDQRLVARGREACRFAQSLARVPNSYLRPRS
jgi:hypothetical protein